MEPAARTLRRVFQRFSDAVPALLAHQGGWDEALLVAVPMVLLAWLLWLAQRRFRRAERSAGESPRAPSNPLDAGTDGG